MSARHRLRRSHRTSWRRASLPLIAAGLAVTAAAAPALAGGAISTTTHTTAGSGLCVNPDGSQLPAGEDPVNCNAYTAKTDVWLSNLPHDLDPGDYFFAISVPGTQSAPNGDNVLSFDDRSHRAFRVEADGDVVPLADLDPGRIVDGRIQLAPFDDTTNGGGVYIASVCQLPDPIDADVDGNDCNHDAFKVVGDDTPTYAAPLTIDKTADGTFTRTYAWDVTKTAASTELHGTSGSVSTSYTVTAFRDGGTVSGVAVSGTVTVSNPNGADAVVDVTEDGLSNGVSCSLVGGTDATIPAHDSVDFAYTCSLAPGDETATLTNTASVTWDEQVLGSDILVAGDASDTTDTVAFSGTEVGECAAVTDTFPELAALPGDESVCDTGADGTAFTYTKSFPLTSPGCTTVDNTASLTPVDGVAGDQATATVKVCKDPLATGARTIGFWQNKNGQAVLGTSCPGATAYLTSLNPFKDLTVLTCKGLQDYVKKVLGAATAAGPTMNAMLKGQMLATALDVHYTGPGSTTTSQKFLPHSTLGDVDVDLTHVDGTAVSAAFGGASHLTVSQALSHAASQSNSGGTVWYGQAKTTQELAKNLFDAINNERAYAW
jgi:hypothetical protein